MKIGITLAGENALSAMFSRLDIAKSLETTLRTVAEDIRQAATVNLSDIHHANGLAESLTVTPGNGSIHDSLSFSISTPLDYGWHLEFGSLNFPPQPWLVPAVDAASPTIQRRLHAWLDAVVKLKL